MSTHDPRVDAYIAKAAPFAQPILTQLRALVHRACPDATETIKWGFPHFDYRGGMLCSMASFKQHCAFGFWKGALILPSADNKGREAMGHLGRITSPKELPSATQLTRWVRAAMRLNEAGVTVKRVTKVPATVRTPPALAAALKANPRAAAQWKAFTLGVRKEYSLWIAGAKQEATRARRVATAVAQIAEGKRQNWKYER
ncbi:MAG: YdeI/OmpD-associated family protein [Gemmatimonadaceae bacterium]|nr:YdeI/OmpD-associated family protein [Gemmatimonadaceae bacterium]